MKSLIKLAVFLVIALLVAGYFMDWYSIESTEDEDGNKKFSLTLDEDKIKDDAEKAKEKAGDLAEKVKKKAASKLANTETVEGTLAGLDIPAGALRLKTTDGQEISLVVTPEVDIELAGTEGSLAGLNQGDQILAHYRVVDEKKVAVRLSVKRD